jgi:hypothetical protein
VQVHHFKSTHTKARRTGADGSSTKAKPSSKPIWRPETGSLTRDELRAIVAAVVG